MFYGSKLREIHIVQLMLLGPKPPATITISSLFKEITLVAESFAYSWEKNPEKTWNSTSGKLFPILSRWNVWLCTSEHLSNKRGVHAYRFWKIPPSTKKIPPFIDLM